MNRDVNKTDPKEEASLQDHFVQLFAQHQRQVHAYIGKLLPNRADADDVMQETSLVLWKKWGQFDRDRMFLPWACGIALREVLKYRRLRGKNRLLFNEELIKSLAVEAMDQTQFHDQRREALLKCMDKLGDHDRHLIKYRYQSAVTARQTASDLGRPESTVYKALVRIREALYQCVQRKIAQQSHP